MAKGQHLSSYQRGIVKRYYAHLDSITLAKLSELVSDLAVTEPGAKADKLWAKVEKALDKTAAADDRVRGVLNSRNINELARLVSELSARPA
ncbi:MAG: hypothetical protein AB7G17_11365 [Phycisphaerales bacterium]